VSVALQKLEGVTTVNVMLKEGRATVSLKPGNHVTVSELRRVVERNGFTPQEAAVVAEAEVIQREADRSEIKVTGTNEVFPLSHATKDEARAALKKYAGKKVVIEALIPPPKANPSGAIELKTVKPAAD
jgi:hypothetical protein